MVRRLVAVMTLVVTALLMHLTVPHDSVHLASAGQRATAQPDSAQSAPLAYGVSRAESAESHHETADDLVTLPSAQIRHVPPSDASVSAADGGQDTATGDLPAGSAHARTARDRWNPGSGVTPTPAVLQTFRC